MPPLPMEEGARNQYDTKGTLSTLNGSVEGRGKKGSDSNRDGRSPGDELQTFSTILQKTLDERFFGGGKKTYDHPSAERKQEHQFRETYNWTSASPERKRNIVINEHIENNFPKPTHININDNFTPIVIKKKLTS